MAERRYGARDSLVTEPFSSIELVALLLQTVEGAIPIIETESLPPPFRKGTGDAVLGLGDRQLLEMKRITWSAHRSTYKREGLRIGEMGFSRWHVGIGSM